MAEETRERSCTTVLEKMEMTKEQIIASQLKKVLYLLNGTGSDRDRTVDIEVLRNWMFETAEHLRITGNDGTMELTRLLLQFASTGGYKVEFGADGVTFSQESGGTSTTSLSITKTGITIAGVGGNVTIQNGAITITGSELTATMANNKFEIVKGSKKATIEYDSNDEDFKIDVKKAGFTDVSATNISASKFRRMLPLQRLDKEMGASFKTLSDLNITGLPADTLLALTDTTAGSGGTPALKLDLTPAANTELVIDYQQATGTTGGALYLAVQNGTGTLIRRQAPNTVCRYVYLGSTDGWAALY